MTFKVLICGGRDFTAFEDASNIVRDHLATMSWDSPEKNEIMFISGMAKGADQIPFYIVDGEEDEWAGILEFPADWEKYGRKAGPVRNQQMIDQGQPDLVIAFPTEKSTGTYDMIRRAKKHNIEVVVYGPTEWSENESW